MVDFNQHNKVIIVIYKTRGPVPLNTLFNHKRPLWRGFLLLVREGMISSKAFEGGKICMPS